MLSPDHLAYKILHKVVNHHEKQPTVKLIYIETEGETKLSEMTYRLFLKSMEAQGYLKIWAENKDDWGQIIVTPYGIQFAQDFLNSEISERDYENLSEYLDMLIKKNTKDLIRAKKSAEIHLQKQIEMMEFQRGLATNGKPNCYSTYVRQVDTARLEVHTIDEELETRKILGMETADRIGHANKPIARDIPLTKDQQKQVDYDKWINKDFTFANTLEQFLRILKANKRALSEKEYILLLLEWHEIYNNSSHYYSIWGPPYLSDNHSEINTRINLELDNINEINIELPKKSETLKKEIPNAEPIISDSLSLNTLQNHFDHVLLIEVYNHFYNAFVKTNHLTENELLGYLKCAFDELKPSTQFKLRNSPTKQRVMKVFYGYYKNVASKPHGERKKYAALLGEYFYGYSTDLVSTNFSK